jgi:hypothetical protein
MNAFVVAKYGEDGLADANVSWRRVPALNIVVGT